jgi:hypothetical protein
MEIFLYFVSTTLLGFILGRWNYFYKQDDNIQPEHINVPIRVSTEEIRLRQRCIELTSEVERLKHTIWHLQKE